LKKSDAARAVEKINKLEADECIVAYYRKLRRIDAPAAYVFIGSFLGGLVFAGCCLARVTRHSEELLVILAVILASAFTGYRVRAVPLFEPLAESDQCGTVLNLAPSEKLWFLGEDVPTVPELTTGAGRFAAEGPCTSYRVTLEIVGSFAT